MKIKNVLKHKLSEYLSNEISQETLYNWSVDILHKMLISNIFDLDYLEVWGLITELTELDDMDHFYCDEIAHRLKNTLSGAECASYTFAMKIPPDHVVHNMPGMKEILLKYSAEKHLSADDIRKLRECTQRERMESTTVNELLENQIIALLKFGYELSYEEENVSFVPKSTVFISETIEKSLEENLLKKVMELFDCYEGKSSFFVHINFKNGTGNISI